MIASRRIIWLAIVFDISTLRSSATVTLDSNPARYEKSRDRGKIILTNKPATQHSDSSTNQTTTSVPYLLNEQQTTAWYPPTYTIHEKWNQTCHEGAEFRRSAESFLNYLLRLQTCAVLLGDNELLQNACETRRYNFTEYYRIAYLRFCDTDLYNEVCKEKIGTKLHVTDRYRVGGTSPGRYESSGRQDDTLITGQRAKDFLQNEDDYMVEKACFSIEDFSTALMESELYENETFKYDNPSEIAFVESAHVSDGNTSLPTVVFSEWYNPIVPFCRAFTCGASLEEYQKDPVSFYNCMPKRCKLTIIFSIIFDAILAVLTIIANSLVLGVAARTKIMRNIPGYFKISLAVADFIVGVVVLPTCIFNTYTFYIGPLPFRHPGQIPQTSDYISRPLANFLGFFFILSFALSVYTMGMASIDRYLAITKPFKYRQGQYLTKRRCVVVFAFIWLVGFFVALYPVFTSEPYALTGYNLLLSTGISSAIVYAIGLCIPLVAVWSLNGAMLCQVCADGEKRRSIRATGVLAAAGPQSSIRDRSATPSTFPPAPSTEGVQVSDKSIDTVAAPTVQKKKEVFTDNMAYTPRPKQIVSRNISSSSVNYHKNEKRSSVPTNEGIIQRMKRNRGKKGLQNSQKNNLARQPSITNTAANVERRLARTLAIMIGAFTFAILPNIVTLIIYICTSSDSSPTTHVRLATALYVTSRILLSNSFWNCIIYSIRNRHFRRAMWAIFLLKKHKIDRKLRTSVTMSNWKRRSRMQSSSGSSVHDRQSLSKTSSSSSSVVMYQNKEHRRSTMMWSLSSTSPSPSRKSSTDILNRRPPMITRSVSHNVDSNANKTDMKNSVTRCESAPPAQECKKFIIPTVSVEMIEEAQVTDAED